MRRTHGLWIIAATFVASAAWADECEEFNCGRQEPGSLQEPGTVEEMAPVTTAREGEVRSAVKDEVLGVKPQAGVMVFNSPIDDTSQSRGVLGMTLDWNVTKAILGDRSADVFLGPSIGVLYSHVGTGRAGFFGNGDGTNNQFDGGANLLLLPANLKLGWNMTDNFRLSAHGGGNVIYRSVANSMRLGDGSSADSSLWKIYPNIGGDIEIGLGKAVGLLIRPDFTLTPQNDVFTGTVGISASLG
jgi:hypothetical protein